MSGFLAVCVRLSLHRGRGWEGEVSKWFLFYSCLVFSRSFVHDCKTAKCFPNQGSAPSCDRFGRHGEWKKYLATKILAKVTNWRPAD